MRRKQPGQDLLYGKIVAENNNGSYDVRIDGCKTTLKSISNISKFKGKVGDSVKVGFHDASRQLPFIFDLMGSKVGTVTIEPVNPIFDVMWQEPNKDSYNSSYVDYPFPAVVGGNYDWYLDINQTNAIVLYDYDNITDYLYCYRVTDKKMVKITRTGGIPPPPGWETELTDPIPGVAVYDTITNCFFYNGGICVIRCKVSGNDYYLSWNIVDWDTMEEIKHSYFKFDMTDYLVAGSAYDLSLAPKVSNHADVIAGYKESIFCPHTRIIETSWTGGPSIWNFYLFGSWNFDLKNNINFVGNRDAKYFFSTEYDALLGKRYNNKHNIIMDNHIYTFSHKVKNSDFVNKEYNLIVGPAVNYWYEDYWEFKQNLDSATMANIDYITTNTNQKADGTPETTQIITSDVTTNRQQPDYYPKLWSKTFWLLLWPNINDMDHRYILKMDKNNFNIIQENEYKAMKTEDYNPNTQRLFGQYQKVLLNAIYGYNQNDKKRVIVHTTDYGENRNYLGIVVDDRNIQEFHRIYFFDDSLKQLKVYQYRNFLRNYPAAGVTYYSFFKTLCVGNIDKQPYIFIFAKHDFTGKYELFALGEDGTVKTIFSLNVSPFLWDTGIRGGCCDSEGNIIIYGRDTGDPSGGKVLCYDINGVLQWTKHIQVTEVIVGKDGIYAYLNIPVFGRGIYKL